MALSRKTLSAEAASELQKVGKSLASARKRRGLTAGGLASRIGVDRRTLAQLEKGNPAVSVGVLFQALSVLSLLRGIEEIVRPENDLEAISASIRRIRRRLPPEKPIGDDRVDF